MTEKQMKKIENLVTEHLQRHFIRGIQEGSKAICYIVLKKAKSADGSNDTEVIKDIIEFCEKSLGMQDGDEQN